MSTGFKFNAFCICAALITYTSMYAFRKPLSAATFEGIVYWGVDYKVIALISQVIGYTCSKFLGIKIVSGMKPTQRTAYILSLVGIAWISLLLFALVPAPTNIIFLLTNGLPLGMIFGIVISFLEGRKNTELLGAGLCVSFITASGITKAVGKFLILHLGISDFWMPFLVGLLFVPLLLLGVWMLGKIPPPSAEDTALRGKRQPMSLTQRVAFFHQFAWGVILSTLVYATLTVYRDLRDNFTVEIWEFFGLGDNVSILAISEICIAVIVLIVIASMIKVVNNRKAFFPHHVFRTLDGSLQISGQYRFSYLCLRFVWLPRQRRRTAIQKLHVARHRLAALHPNHRLRRRLPYCRTFNPALFLFPIQNATCEGTKKKNDFSSVMEISHMQIPY